MDAHVKVASLPPYGPAFHRHRCKRCHRDLGFYYILRGDEEWALADLSARWVVRPEDRPRTGTGLSPETYEGVGYVRIRCKCGPRNEKLRISKYLDLPVTAEGNELLVDL